MNQQEFESIVDRFMGNYPDYTSDLAAFEAAVEDIGTLYIEVTRLQGELHTSKLNEHMWKQRAESAERVLQTTQDTLKNKSKQN